jgi:hypothetical protein
MHMHMLLILWLTFLQLDKRSVAKKPMDTATLIKKEIFLIYKEIQNRAVVGGWLVFIVLGQSHNETSSTKHLQ